MPHLGILTRELMLKFLGPGIVVVTEDIQRLI